MRLGTKRRPVKAAREAIAAIILVALTLAAAALAWISRHT